MKLLIFCVFFAIVEVVPAENVVCTFTSWTIYRPSNGKFAAENVDPTLCTHLTYVFTILDTDGTMVVADDWEADGLHEIDNLVDLKYANPDLKILVGIGGWNDGSQKYSEMSAKPQTRAKFIQSVVDFINKWKLDGFDIDWQYPGQREGSDPQNDKKNIVILLEELKAALEPRNLILSATVAAGESFVSTSYNVSAISDAVDMINVLTYQYYDAYAGMAGQLAPLYPSSLDVTPGMEKLNVEYSINLWLDQGADPSKLNLAIATFGVSYLLADSKVNGLYSPTTGAGGQGPYTAQPGLLGYNEICEKNLTAPWTYVFDEEQKVPHVIQEKLWVGYDDVTSVTAKIEFAKGKELGGVMVWSLDTDDFLGKCGEKYPLLTAINEAYKS